VSEEPVLQVNPSVGETAGAAKRQELQHEGGGGGGCCVTWRVGCCHPLIDMQSASCSVWGRVSHSWGAPRGVSGCLRCRTESTLQGSNHMRTHARTRTQTDAHTHTQRFLRCNPPNGAVMATCRAPDGHPLLPGAALCWLSVCVCTCVYIYDWVVLQELLCSWSSSNLKHCILHVLVHVVLPQKYLLIQYLNNNWFIFSFVLNYNVKHKQMCSVRIPSTSLFKVHKDISLL